MLDKKKVFWFIVLLSIFVIIFFLGEIIFYFKGELCEVIVVYLMLESGNWILFLNYGIDIVYKFFFLYWFIVVIFVIFGGVSEFLFCLLFVIVFLVM